MQCGGDILRGLDGSQLELGADRGIYQRSTELGSSPYNKTGGETAKPTARRSLGLVEPAGNVGSSLRRWWRWWKSVDESDDTLSLGILTTRPGSLSKRESGRNICDCTHLRTNTVYDERRQEKESIFRVVCWPCFSQSSTKMRACCRGVSSEYLGIIVSSGQQHWVWERQGGQEHTRRQGSK